MPKKDDAAPTQTLHSATVDEYAELTSALSADSLKAVTESCKDVNSSLLTGKGLIIVRLRKFNLDRDTDYETGQKFEHLTKVIVNIQGAESVARSFARLVVD